MGKKNPQFQSYPGSKQLIIIILTIGVHQCQFERSSTSIGGTFGGGGLEGSCTYLIYIYIIYHTCKYVYYSYIYTLFLLYFCCKYAFYLCNKSSTAKNYLETKAANMRDVLKRLSQFSVVHTNLSLKSWAPLLGAA